ASTVGVACANTVRAPHAKKAIAPATAHTWGLNRLGVPKNVEVMVPSRRAEKHVKGCRWPFASESAETLLRSSAGRVAFLHDDPTSPWRWHAAATGRHGARRLSVV